MAKDKKTKADDYRSLDDQGLVNAIADEEMRMKKLQFSHAVNPIENPLSILSLRRRLARLKTEQKNPYRDSWQQQDGLDPHRYCGAEGKAPHLREVSEEIHQVHGS